MKLNKDGPTMTWIEWVATSLLLIIFSTMLGIILSYQTNPCIEQSMKELKRIQNENSSNKSN